MGAQRTWRLGFAASQGGSYVQIAEVAFLDAGGVDLSVGGVASASSEYSSGYAAGMAFDKATGTEWATAYGAIPAWLQYQHAAPVDVAQVRIVCPSSSGYTPTNLASLSLTAGDAQEDRYTLSLVSGGFVAGGTLVLSVQPYVPPPPLQVHSTPAVGSLLQNFNTGKPASGVISDRVMFKATPSSPESPFAMGRVLLLRLDDGAKVWEGWSDASGYYTATGLDLGVEYIAVGIDPYRNHKATGAGPVVATEAAP